MNRRLTSISNEVVIIGADHHNTLAIVRCLGASGLRIRILLHGHWENGMTPKLAYCKYAQNKVACCNEEASEIVTWLLANEPKDEPTILFPCSDFSAFVIDTSEQLAGKNFIFPGFQGQRGEVGRMMDKWEQMLFAQRHGFPMAKTWKVNIHTENMPEDIIYPCIVKPIISAAGSKSDIRICQTAKELGVAIEEFEKKGYEELLIQEFLKKLYEECAYGCVISSEPKICGGIIKKVRENPPGGGGSLSFAQFLGKNEFVNSIAYKVLEVLQTEGYRGMFDVELFVCENGVYLNEINFRHSGNGYALLRNGVPAPLFYCLDVAGYVLPENSTWFVEEMTYHMDELSDLTHVYKGRISSIEWLKCVCKTRAFAKFWIGDIRGSLIWFKPLVKSVIQKVKIKLLRKR